MSYGDCECMSPQERRLADHMAGKEDVFRKSHKRAFRLVERIEGQKPSIDIEYFM